MKIKPILMSGEMVRAILEGHKTETRRIVKPQPSKRHASVSAGLNLTGKAYRVLMYKKGNKNEVDAVNYVYEPNDILWVRETCQYTDALINIEPGWVYRATDPDWSDVEGFKWRPSIFMPKSACRIFLKVTEVKFERLSDIGLEDIIAEGIKSDNETPLEMRWINLWNSIHGKDAHKKNPIVWVYKFERVGEPLGFRD